MLPAEPTIPAGLQVLPAPDGSTLIRHVWRSWVVGPLAVFALIWNSFLYFWYSMALSAPELPWIMVVFPIGHVAVGIGLVYFIVALLVNRTDVTISGAGVRVWHGPAPWPGNRRVPAEAIWQVLVRERRGSKGSVSYRVLYAGKDHQEHKLLDSVNEADRAEYIAHVIRRTLRLREPAA